jgi:hypothetical protein
MSYADVRVTLKGSSPRKFLQVYSTLPSLLAITSFGPNPAYASSISFSS